DFSSQAEDGIRGDLETGVETCSLPIFGIGLIAGVAVEPPRQRGARLKPDIRDRQVALAIAGERVGEARRHVERSRMQPELVQVEIGRASCRVGGWVSVRSCAIK